MSDREDKQKVLAAALARYRKIQLKDCFDPFDLDSRPTETQMAIFKAVSEKQYRYVIAGNRCLAEGTMIATSKGPKAIQDIQPDDIVYDEFGSETKVLKTFSNGRKEVVELTNRNQVWAESTDNHTWLTDDDSKFNLKERKVSEFYKGVRIKRNEITSQLGSVSEPHAYTIGALLGDGCSREDCKSSMSISGDDIEVLHRISKDLGCTFEKKHKDNYTWRLTTKDCNYYKEWCSGRYAHEKIADLEVIKSWDRDTLLAFMSGLIDTDGSVYVNQYKNLCIQFGMQAKSVVEAFKYGCLALWNIDPTIHEDARDKYKNGSVYYIRLANNAYTKRALYELDRHLQIPRKKWKSEYSDYVCKKTNPNWVGIKLGQRRVVETYDIHVDSSTNLYCLANGLVTHNSGKTALAARELAWIVNDEHPYFDKEAHFGNKPLTCLVVGKSRQGIEEELWNKKIKPFLDEGEWKINRSGNVIQSVQNRRTKDSIVFLTHADSSQRIIDNLQMYTADYVWVDEMPKSLRVLEELQRRTDTTDGPFIATFTPKVVSLEVRNFIEKQEELNPEAKIYRMSKLDNPLFAGKVERELAKLIGLPESLRNTVLYGDWSAGDNMVYEVDYDKHVGLPEGYDRSWRHVLSVDPALKSKLGLTLWAESPTNGIWYCVKADYIEKVYVPTDLVDAVEAKVVGYNICRRICDPHEVWYITTASRKGFTYMGVYKKNDRKGELIKNLQQALGAKILVTPWADGLLNEFSACQWSDTVDGKISNGSKYHMLDTAQYFVDNIPTSEIKRHYNSHNQMIWEGHWERKKEEQLRLRAKTAESRTGRGKWIIKRTR